MANRTNRSLSAFTLAALVGLATACVGGEEPQPFDLTEGASTTTQGVPDDPGVDPNAGVRSQAVGFAEQQCIDDPELAEGVIQIAEQDTGEVVNRVVADCADVRERAAAGEPVGIEIVPEELRPTE